MVKSILSPRFFPTDGDAESAPAFGFRLGAKGTHTSRTLMFEEVSVLLTSTKPDATRKDYAAAIIDMNCLAKPTAASRRLTNQRLGELYALDPTVPVFRVFRRLWGLAQEGRRILAMLCAIARDPLLAATTHSIISLSPGKDFQRDLATDDLRSVVGERINDSVLAKVVRNAASSWTQSGHLAGRTFKKRQKVQATPATIAYGLYLANIAGFRGNNLFASAWVTLQDSPVSESRQLALEAKRLGLIDLRIAGEVIQIGFDRLDPMATRN